MAKHYKLTLQEQAATGFTDKFVLTHADLTETGADTDQTIPLLAVKAGTVVGSEVGYKLVIPFEDASDAALNTTKISVGETDTDRFLTATEMNKNGTEVLYKVTANAVDTLPFAFTADDTIDATVESMSAKSLVDIDVGEVHLYLHLFDLNAV